jgi:transposase
MDELTGFIQSNPDSRELKRALAVQMVLQEYTYFAIRDVLQVSVGFISKWKQAYERQRTTAAR